MIVLDTNVVSEAIRGAEADPRVLAWLEGLSEPPVTTVITRAELLAGVAVLPQGARRARLEVGVGRILSQLGVCLPLTDEAVGYYAEIVAVRGALGRPAAGFDALIGGICRSVSAMLATRNVSDFEAMGVPLVNPWEDDGQPRSA